MRLAARNTDAKLSRRMLSLDSFVADISSWPRPIVVVETAGGAADIHAFKFPERCDVLVGGETRGVHPSILAALRPGIDATVYIPMQGFSKSMSEAAPSLANTFDSRAVRETRPASARVRCRCHLCDALRIPTAASESLKHTCFRAACRGTCSSDSAVSPRTHGVNATKTSEHALCCETGSGLCAVRGGVNAEEVKRTIDPKSQ
eukprot:4549412-Prymnesium_polylepis.1